MAISRNKQFLAVAEATEKTPICIVYDLTKMSEAKPGEKDKIKRKVIASTEIQGVRYYSSIAFCPSNHNLLATLTEPGETPANWTQQQVLIWQWDKLKCIAMQIVQISSTSFAN